MNLFIDKNKRKQVNLALIDTRYCLCEDESKIFKYLLSMTNDNGVIILIGDELSLSSYMMAGKRYWKYNFIVNNVNSNIDFGNGCFPINKYSIVSVFSKSDTFTYNPLYESKPSGYTELLKSIGFNIRDEKKVPYMPSVLKYHYNYREMELMGLNLPVKLYTDMISVFSNSNDKILQNICDNSFLGQDDLIRDRIYISYNKGGYNNYNILNSTKGLTALSV